VYDGHRVKSISQRSWYSKKYLVNTRSFTSSPWWVFVRKCVYVRVYTCVGERTHGCNWLYVYFDLHIYNYIHIYIYTYLYVCICMYIFMYVCICIYTYEYTWKRALTRLETGRQVAMKQCAKKVCWIGTELEFERSAASWNLKEVLTCASSRNASNAWPLGPAAFFREVRKKRTIDHEATGYILLVRNGLFFEAQITFFESRVFIENW